MDKTNKDIKEAVERGREEAWIEWTDLLEIWMEAHDRQDKDFDTDSLLKFIKKGGK